MVVINKLRKASHFILVQSTYETVHIADIFMREVFRLHGIPKTIISEKDVKFSSTFWKNLFTGLVTQIIFSSAYHPQTYGQTKWVD